MAQVVEFAAEETRHCMNGVALPVSSWVEGASFFRCVLFFLEGVGGGGRGGGLE